MKADEDRLESLLESVSDGAPVDWSEAESSARSDRERVLIRDLKVVARMAEVHRGSGREGPLGASDAPAPARAPRHASAPRGRGAGGPAPERWGPLEIVDLVGEGTFGEVYRAVDARLGREVALKLLKNPASGGGPVDTGGADVLVEEARHLARLRHPNVVTVHGADRFDGRVGLWMEFVRGRTLEEIVRERGPMEPREAALAAIDLCRALAAVHGAGLVHGDLKARNVLREERGRIVLMDFGGGRDWIEDHDPGRSDALSGTPLYMAPETLRGAPATTRSDLYSLGVLLFHLLTGTYPVGGRTTAEILAAHDRGGARRLLDVRPDLPGPLVRIVEKALAPDPSARFESAGAMEAALGAFLGEALSPPERGGATRPARSAGRRGLLSLVAAAAAGVAIWMAWPALRGSPGPAAGSYTVEASFWRGGPDGSRKLQAGDRLSPGDELFLRFEADEPVFLYVLNADEEGAAYLLFPLPGLRLTNPLPARVAHRLPDSRVGRQSYWQVTSTGGREHFLVVASREPLTEIETDLAALPRARPGAPLQNARLSDGSIERLRGLGGIVERPSGKAATEVQRLFDRVRRLAASPEKATGVWIRQIDFENPAPDLGGPDR